MLSDVSAWKERIKRDEEKRVGDIYSECIKRGCEKRFLESFDTRIWLFPITQTRLFIERRSKANAYNAEKHLRQWEIYLEVLLEKRPDHEKAKEWRESLKILEDEIGK